MSIPDSMNAFITATTTAPPYKVNGSYYVVTSCPVAVHGSSDPMKQAFREMDEVNAPKIPKAAISTFQEGNIIKVLSMEESGGVFISEFDTETEKWL